MWWEDTPLEGKSILVLENAPDECSDCRLQSIESEFSDDGLTWSTRAYCTARTETEINNLMRENGQLSKQIEKLRKDVEWRDEVGKSNYEMYRESLEKKDSLLKSKEQYIEWIESFASAFLVVAYGEDAGEIRFSQDDILKMMTAYRLTCRFDEESKEWIMQASKKE